MSSDADDYLQFEGAIAAALTEVLAKAWQAVPRLRRWPVRSGTSASSLGPAASKRNSLCK
jgi:hypothetical protein